MRTWFLSAISVIALSTACNADCFSEQRAVDALKTKALDMWNDRVFTFSNTCITVRALFQWRKAEAAFYRNCYAELGMTKLQAEAKALDNEQNMRAARGCGNLN
jgi:hypothetical protein